MVQDIKEMLNDLNIHKRPKNTLLKYFIECRLETSIKTYYDQLLKSVDYLSLSQDPDNVIIKLNKEDFN